MPAQNRFEIGTVGVSKNWSDTAAWATSSGGAGGATVPSSSNPTFLDSHSGDLIVDTAAAPKSLDMTGYVGALSGTASLTLNTTLTLASGMTNTFTGVLTFNTTTTWTSNGIAVDNLMVDATGATVTQNDAATVSHTLTLTNGTLTTGGFALHCGAVSSSNSNTRTLTLTNSTVTLTGTGTVWDTSTATGLTLTATGSTIVISDTSATGKTFAGGGQTFNNLTITGSAGTVTFTGANTFATFTSGVSSLVFSAAQTATVWVLTGCKSLTGNIVCASGTVNAPSGCTITNSAASGGATFNASSAINGGGNTGWVFTHASDTLAQMPSMGLSNGIGI